MTQNTNMANIDRLIRNFEEMRVCLHDTFNGVVPELIAKLEAFADELDETYKAVKISKVAGNSACVVGGVLAAVGFGLSFVTFGASLGLCIAGGVIGGAGGITNGGASIAEHFKAKEAKTKAREELEKFNKNFREVLEKCQEISEGLEQYWDIEEIFPDWLRFWEDVVKESGKVAYNIGWKMVAKTVINAIRLAKRVDVTADAASAAIPLVKISGAAARGIYIAGGVVGAIFLPVDVICLVSNAVEIHKNTAHKDAERIRKIVEEIKEKRIAKERIDTMIDSCIATILEGEIAKIIAKETIDTMIDSCIATILEGEIAEIIAKETIDTMIDSCIATILEGEVNPKQVIPEII